MQTAGARVLQEDEHDMSREAVLLQWERKIEAAERRPGRAGEDAASAEEATVEELRPTEDATHAGRRRFERAAPAPAGALPDRVGQAERRTITITGRPQPARRRRSVIDSQWPSPIGSPCGRSCWASSWWPWPPGPRTPEGRQACTPEPPAGCAVERSAARRRPGRAGRIHRALSRASTCGPFRVSRMEWKSLHFPTTLTAGKSYAEREAR